MAAPQKPFDWRVPAIWAILLTISLIAHVYVDRADAARHGLVLTLGNAVVIEASSHIVVAALVPAIYWLHRRFPIGGGRRNIAVHVLTLLPFSLVHTLGMAALRLLWFVGIAGQSYDFPLDAERLLYEFSKDLISYGLLSTGVLALIYLLGDRGPVASKEEAAAVRPERFAVRQRGKETLVEVADIDWVEAAGNYAILHVGGETFEIRSSLTKLEAELDPKRFVRVHKSHMVNIARVAEVTPWISGDWRIRLQDGAEVNLSRRYRDRFEALAPVRS
jgi:hypothetical protein